MRPRPFYRAGSTRIVIMTPDRDYASRFIAESRHFERQVEVSACISVAATMMLSAQYAPDLILLDACYGESMLKQVVCYIQYALPNSIQLLLCEQVSDAARNIAPSIQANGWVNKDIDHNREIFNLLCSVAMSHRETGMRQRIKWSSSQMEVGFS